MIFIEETKLTLLIGSNYFDTIIIEFDGPNPFPKSDMKDYKPQLFLEVQVGDGLEYCRTVFNKEPIIINQEQPLEW